MTHCEGVEPSRQHLERRGFDRGKPRRREMGRRAKNQKGSRFDSAASAWRDAESACRAMTRRPSGDACGGRARTYSGRLNSAHSTAACSSAFAMDKAYAALITKCGLRRQPRVGAYIPRNRFWNSQLPRRIEVASKVRKPMFTIRPPPRRDFVHATRRPRRSMTHFMTSGSSGSRLQRKPSRSASRSIGWFSASTLPQTLSMPRVAA